MIAMQNKTVIDPSPMIEHEAATAIIKAEMPRVSLGHVMTPAAADMKKARRGDATK